VRQLVSGGGDLWFDEVEHRYKILNLKMFSTTDGQELHYIAGNHSRLKLILALREEQLAGLIKIFLRHEDLGWTVQVAIVGQSGILEFLRGGDTVLFQHHHKQFRFDDRAGEE
jgi:hypothetical protein